MPRRQRCHGRMRVTSPPAKMMRPPLGGKTPAIMLNNVVLPAPFGPRMPTISPSSTLKSSRSITTRPPKVRESEASSSIGAVVPIIGRDCNQLEYCNGLEGNFRLQHKDGCRAQSQAFYHFNCRL